MTACSPVPSPAPTHRRRGRAVLLAAMVVLGAGGVVVAGTPVAAEVARVVQDPAATVTSTAVADGADLEAEEGENPLNNADEIARENRRIWLVVGGLVVVAVALLLVTIRYWRQTKPIAVAGEPEASDGAGAEDEEAREGDPAPERVRRDGRRSRRSVAGADHATADSDWEPRGTGEHDRIEAAPANRRAPRISRDQRRAAYEAARR